MSAEEMAKIGFLCLKKGVFHNKRIVSEKWLEESTKVRLCCGEKFRNMAYGYLWWIIDENEGSYAAIGNSGNVIYVNADKDLVISIAATFKPAIFDRIEFIKNPRLHSVGKQSKIPVNESLQGGADERHDGPV